MKQHRNFGLSRQEPTKETYDNFKLGKDWDLGFLSKEGIKVRREQKKAETDSTKAQTAAFHKILSEPTQTQGQGGGIDAKTAITITVIAVVGLIIGYTLLNKKRKTKQATVQENSLVVNEIV